MDYNKFDLRFDADVTLETSLTRQAYGILRTFGNDTSWNIATLPTDEDSLLYDVDEDDLGIEYCYTATEYCLSVDGKYCFSLDQLPMIDQNVVTDIGYVAVHVSMLDGEGSTEDELQVVFRQEFHAEGTQIMITDENGYDQQIVIDLEHQLALKKLLDYISYQFWNDAIADPYSGIRLMPMSEIEGSL